VIRHGQKVWELEQDVLIEGKAPKNIAPTAPRLGRKPQSGKAEQPLPAVQAREQYSPPNILAPNEQAVRSIGNRYGEPSQPAQVEPLAGFVAETPTAFSWLARAGAAEGAAGGTTVGSGTALGGGAAAGGLGAPVAVVAGVGLVAIAAWVAAGDSLRRAFREWESKEEALVNSKTLHESVGRAIYQQWQNGIITDEEYLNYLATGVLVTQERPFGDSANRDIRGTNSTGVPGTGAVGAGTLGEGASSPATGTKRSKGKVSTGARPLARYDISEYGRFNIKGRVGDPFDGHEILLNSWLQQQGLITRRGSGLSRFNSAIALTVEEHAAVSALQRERHLYDEAVLQKMTARQVILANAQILLDAGVPMERVIAIIDDSLELLTGTAGKATSGRSSPTSKTDDTKKKK